MLGDGDCFFDVMQFVSGVADAFLGECNAGLFYDARVVGTGDLSLSPVGMMLESRQHLRNVRLLIKLACLMWLRSSILVA